MKIIGNKLALSFLSLIIPSVRKYHILTDVTAETLTCRGAQTRTITLVFSNRSPLGRARAWLRLALMQKRLADYFRMLVERRESLLRSVSAWGSLLSPWYQYLYV